MLSGGEWQADSELELKPVVSGVYQFRSRQALEEGCWASPTSHLTDASSSTFLGLSFLICKMTRILTLSGCYKD